MQLIVNIKNNILAEKILKILEIFKSDGVEVKTINKTKEISNGKEYDVDYERSFQYKLDRADFIEMKERLWIIYLTIMLSLTSYQKEEE